MLQPVLPAYGRASLADLLPSVGARLGLPGSDDVLDLPEAERYLLVLVDGLGSHQLAEYADTAPYLATLAGPQLTAGVPSTTATSITSLGTGLVPGRHGIAGYSFWYAGSGAVLTTLRWPAQLSALDVQPQLTFFERLARAGIPCATIAPAAFAGTGLTTAALRGPTFWPVVDETDTPRRAELARNAMAGARLGYLYERRLDHVGHAEGVGSPGWLAALADIDELLAALRAALPGEVALLVTGDHGMVNVPAGRRLLVEDEPGLLTEVEAFAGEGRLRQLRVRPGRAAAVADRWRDRLGEQAWIHTREEAVDLGWFGELSPRLADRFGDVLVAMATDGAVLSRGLPKELGLVGMHGSLTAAEMAVPLLLA